MCDENWESPDKHVGYLLKSLMHGVRQSTEAALREAGLELSMAQLVTLSSMRTEPGLPGAQLAKRLNITAQSMNAILRQLEDATLAAREPHPTNQRAQRWFITDTGMAQLQKAGAACQPVFTQMGSRLDASERLQLIGLLKRCLAGLGRGSAGNEQ